LSLAATIFVPVMLLVVWWLKYGVPPTASEIDKALQMPVVTLVLVIVGALCTLIGSTLCGLLARDHELRNAWAVAVASTAFGVTVSFQGGGFSALVHPSMLLGYVLVPLAAWAGARLAQQLSQAFWPRGESMSQDPAPTV
jgi:hypothetical protein